MQPGDLRLGELICARVCHDLGGLAGTLVGMLELAQEGADGEAMALACETAIKLSRRLKLLRAIFGPMSEPLSASAIADLASQISDRVQVDTSSLDPALIPERQARLVLAMILLCTDALPFGGVVEVSGRAEGAFRTVAHGPRAAWRPSTLEALESDVPATSRTFLAPFCDLLAQLAGMSFSVEQSPPALFARSYDPVRS